MYKALRRKGGKGKEGRKKGGGKRQTMRERGGRWFMEWCPSLPSKA